MPYDYAGTGPVFLDNQNPRLFAVDSVGSPTKLYFYAKKVATDGDILRALNALVAAGGSGGPLNGKETQVSTWAVEVSADTNDLLKSYSRLLDDARCRRLVRAQPPLLA